MGSGCLLRSGIRRTGDIPRAMAPRSLIGGKQPDRGKLGQTKGDPLA
jgi:hypothetical protein